MRKGSKINWKVQYKLRHNWSHGFCQYREMQISSYQAKSTPFAQLQGSIVITVDNLNGLRAWSTENSQQALSPPLDLHNEKEHSCVGITPTSLSIDSARGDSGVVKILVGFANGSFGIYDFDMLGKRFSSVAFQNTPTPRIVSAVSYSSPYLVTMIDGEVLYVYHFPIKSREEIGIISRPQLLASFGSFTTWPPISISIRKASGGIIISIVFALPTYLSGWSVGLQELRLTTEGEIVANRRTSTVHQGFAPIPTPPFFNLIPHSNLVDCHEPLGSLPIPSRPNFLSYAHPYLLVCHADNTLTLYLVTSNDRGLKIGVGNRLWGHTSSVFGAQIGRNGKAVTIAQGGDIRVWELEESAKLPASKKGLAACIREGLSIKREGTNSNVDYPAQSI